MTDYRSYNIYTKYKETSIEMFIRPASSVSQPSSEAKEASRPKAETLPEGGMAFHDAFLKQVAEEVIDEKIIDIDHF